LLDHDSLHLLSTALRFAASGIVITDRIGTIIWVNPAACELTGYSEFELVGEHTRIFKSGEHVPDFYADLWQTIERGQMWSGVIVNRRKNGALYAEQQTIAPVLGEGGRATHFIAIKQDVTEKQRSQEEFARAHRRLVYAHGELEQRVNEVEGLNQVLREDQTRIEAELHLGRQIQRRLLPRTPDTWHGVDLAVSSVPCFEVGGDYYDFIDLPNDDLGLAIGDVSGKGVGAALIMSSAQAALRIAAPNEPNLARLITRLNALLFRTTPGEKFVTFFLARLSRSDSVLRYVNAGHNPPLVCSRDAMMRLEATGPPLGILEEPVFRESSIPFGVGDTLFLYTDGFNEAENPEGEEFGFKRWEALVGDSAGQNVLAIPEFLAKAIRRFENGSRATDDKTLVILRRTE
jgi:PAS domain S-box-containing protein